MKCNFLKKLFLISTIVVSFFTYSTVNPTQAERTTLGHKFLLTDIVDTGEHFVAVGERGHIVYSVDGLNWQQAVVPVNILLTSVAFKDDNTGFAVGHDASILKTVDGGKVWSIVQYAPELDKPFLSVLANETIIIAVGAYGMFMSSEDGGDNWTTSFHDELLLEEDKLFLEDIKQYEPESYEFERLYMLPHFNNINFISGKYYLAGEAGFAASSFDGVNWQRMQPDYLGSFFSISGNSTKLHLAGLRGTLLESDNAGDSWVPIDTAQPATINSTITFGETKLFLANSGNVFIQQDNKDLSHFVFEDGKAVMSGVFKDEHLVLATESGIKRVHLNQMIQK